jgi:6-phosphogluconolactonase (cycloisomerase 2 family)
MRTQVRFLEVFALYVGLTALSGCGGANNSPPMPDFTLSVSPQSLFVPIGVGSSSLQVSVQAINGFNQAVSVSVTGLPTGVTTAPSTPFSMSAGNSQMVVLSATTGIQPSLQQVSFQAASGTLSHSSTISLSVANAVYAYVANGDTHVVPNDIAGFAVDANTGAVSAVQETTQFGPDSPIDLAVVLEPGGAFVFALTSGGSLSSFRVDPGTGSLTPVQTIGYLQPDQFGLAVHPSGKFLYVPQASCLLVYLIDPTTGNLTQSSCLSLSGFLNRMFLVSPPGNLAYGIGAASGAATSSLNVYSVNQADGSLTVLQSLPFNQPSLVLASDPLGRALYDTTDLLAGGNTCGGLLLWRIDPQTGSLTQLNSSFGPPLCANSISFTPADSFAYVTGESGFISASAIYGGMVDPATGNLTNVAGSPFAVQSGQLVFGVVEPSQGKFLIVNELNPSSVSSWAIDATTGVLSQVSRVLFPLNETAPRKMVIVAPPQN